MDALEEARLFMDYGRDKQAEDLLKDVLDKSASNIPAMLMLLSIYATRKDTGRFYDLARKVKGLGDESAWAQASALGRAVDPGNPEYGGAAEAGGADMLNESGRPAAMQVDMDVGFNIPMDLEVTTAAAPVSADSTGMDFDVSGHTGGGMDFDVTGTHGAVGGDTLLPDFDVTGGYQPIEEKPEPAPHMPLGTPMDLDVTGSHPNPTGGMDFDVTGSQPHVTAGMDFDITGSHANLASMTMDFDVTGSHGAIAMEQPGFSAALNEGAASEDTGMSFDIGAQAAPSSAGGMDFDISGSTNSEPAVASMTPAQGMGGGLAFDGGMDFNISSAQDEPVAQTQVIEDTSSTLAIGGMDFDISSAAPSEPASAPAAPAQDMDDGLAFSGGMDFDIGSAPAGASAQAPVAEDTSSALAFGGMDFDISSTPSAPSAQAPVAVDTSSTLAFGGMDFDVSSSPVQPAVQSQVEEDTISTQVLGGMDFDISGAAPAPAAEMQSTVVLDGGMDFDISGTSDTGSSSLVMPREGSDLSALGGGMDFDISASGGGSTGIDLQLTAGNVTSGVDISAGGANSEQWQNVANKLDLARAFRDMGDVDTARELLGEVLNEGDAEQVEAARSLIQQL